MVQNINDTIVAFATPPGVGAIAVLRLSGKEAWATANKHFKAANGKSLLEQQSHTIHLGHVYNAERVLDQVLISVFKGPRSYTGEDVVEINCHGSQFIQQEILQLFIRAGLRMASPGEFTLRAFLNGKMELDQAEAVADLIASDSEASHRIAMDQMRGGFSQDIKNLREQLLNFASLIELELDFSGEDVEFADRNQLLELLGRLNDRIKGLLDSFALGNAIKTGVPVAIVGAPNVGKSTLLNALLQEERAIVSNIPGTTRDTIEDELIIGGVRFRFIDTAGIRETEDSIERIGIEKTQDSIKKAQLVLYMLEAKDLDAKRFAAIQQEYPNRPLLVLGNKMELLSESQREQLRSSVPLASLISAKSQHGLDELKTSLLNKMKLGELQTEDNLLTNSRHFDALQRTLEALDEVRKAVHQQLPGDLLAIDLRQALHSLGEITGSVTTDDLLGNIFSNFCIGK
jgi:tRNA modification GTPase